MTDQKQAPERIWATFDEDISAQTREVYAQDTDEGFVDRPTEFVRKDLHDAVIKQRDELAAEVERLTKDNNAAVDHLVKWCGKSFDATVRAQQAEAERDEALAECEVWRKNSVDTWAAMRAMRHQINEHIPMPSLESDLLQGPENSIFCATIAEAVVNGIQAQAAAAAIDMRDREAKRLIDVSASLAAAISLLERGGQKAAASDKMFYQMLADYKASLERARTHLNSLTIPPNQQQALDAERAKAWDKGNAASLKDKNPYRKDA